MEVASLQGVTKNYGVHCALSAVNINLKAGKILALLEANGAGKTTAVKLLLGLLKPSNGFVQVLGSDPQNVKARQRMGATLQSASVPETLRVRQYIDLFSTIRASRSSGKTILLTTQYLEDADQSPDRIVVLKHGKIAADASPAGIKSLGS